jgi:hypothetical protein
MAADKTVQDAATVTLSSSTAVKVRLTGPKAETAELIHHGEVSDVIYYQVRSTEEALTSFGVAGDEAAVLLPSERLTLRTPKSGGIWVRLISAGAPSVTIDASEK